MLNSSKLNYSYLPSVTINYFYHFEMMCCFFFAFMCNFFCILYIMFFILYTHVLTILYFLYSLLITGGKYNADLYFANLVKYVEYKF